MSKGRYRPREPQPLRYARIDVRQQRFEGRWLVIFREPCDDWAAAEPIELGEYPTAEEGKTAAILMNRVPEHHVFVSPPIHDMGWWGPSAR